MYLYYCCSVNNKIFNFSSIFIKSVSFIVFRILVCLILNYTLSFNILGMNCLSKHWLIISPQLYNNNKKLNLLFCPLGIFSADAHASAECARSRRSDKTPVFITVAPWQPPRGVDQIYIDSSVPIRDSGSLSGRLSISVPANRFWRLFPVVLEGERLIYCGFQKFSLYARRRSVQREMWRED